ncbi:MAG: RHS repeat protein, partial [Candidatus Hydrogenedentes bacterium]|nr:RHS repeat protein [Candidatus Hydrogenedentota bacterium]
MPFANTPGGTALTWGPSGSTGGVMRLYSGDFTEHSIDLAVPGRGLDFVFARRYLSADATESAEPNDWPIGYYWDHSYNLWIEDPTGGDTSDKVLHFGTNRSAVFQYYFTLGDHIYKSDGWPFQMYKTVEEGPNQGNLNVKDEHGVVWMFSDEGLADTSVQRIVSITDRNGNKTTFEYDASDRVSLITDTLGQPDTVVDPNSLVREYQFAYYTSLDFPEQEEADNIGKLKTITERSGLHRVVQYEYYTANDPDGNVGDLARVIYLPGTPQQQTVAYTYTLVDANSGSIPGHLLLKITDAKNRVVVKNTYDANGDVTEQEFEDNRIHTTYTYENLETPVNVVVDPDSAADRLSAVKQTIVKDGEGLVTQFFFDEDNNLILQRRYTGNWGQSDTHVTSAMLDTVPLVPPNPKVRAGDPAFYETAFGWNRHDNLTNVRDSGGAYTVLEYEPDINDLLASPLKRGHVTKMTRYSTSGIGDPNPKITENSYRFGFDTGGLHLLDHRTIHDRAADESPLTFTTTYGYDARQNLNRITYPDSVDINTDFESFTYQANGLVETHTSRKTSIEHGNGSGQFGRPRTDRYAYLFNANGSYTVTTTDDVGGENAVSTEDYDPSGRLVASADPKRNVWNYTYTPYDQLETALAPAPVSGASRPTTNYAYDNNNNVVTVSVANIDPKLGPAQTAGKLPIVTRYVYDDGQNDENMDRLKQVIRDFGGANATTAYKYDLKGRVTKVLTPEAVSGAQPANFMEYVYDERDLLFKSTHGNSQSDPTQRETTTFDYELWGNLAKETFNDGSRVAYGYDAYGRLSTTTNRVDTVSTIIRRNDRGLVEYEEVKDTGAVLLSKTTTEYDSVGRVSKVFADADTTSGTRFFYTPAGQLWKTIDPEGRVVTSTFDSMHRVAQKKDRQGGPSFGNLVTYIYDNNSNVATVKQKNYDEDADAPIDLPDITYAYDNLDRQIAVTDIAQNTTQYAYDSLNRLRRVTDAKGNTSDYTYDNLGRQIRMDRKESGTTTLATTKQDYDRNGRLVSQTDPKNFTTRYDFDHLDRQFKTTYADGSAMTVIEFDPMGRAKKAIIQDGSVVNNIYDIAGRLLSRSTTPANGTTATTETFAYDGLDRITSQTTTNSNPAETLPASTSYTYNKGNEAPKIRKTTSITPASGQPIERSIETNYLHTGQPQQTVLPGGRTLTYGYNDAGKLKQIATAGTTAGIKYVGGRRKKLTAGPVSTTFAYNPETSGLRVSGTEHSNGSAILDARTNVWDENYNRTARTISTVPNTPTDWAKAHVYVYDELNRMESSSDGMTSKDYNLDKAGNRGQTTDGSFTLSGTGIFLHQYSGAPEGAMAYDAAGRLSERLGPGNSYKYDAMGRLKELIVGASVSFEAFNGFNPDPYTIFGSWDIESADNNDYLRETSINSGGRLLLPPVSNLRTFSFRYLTEQNPAAPGIFNPEYYAQVVLRASQDGQSQEWTFLALVIQPDGIYLREWNDDEVTELGGVAVPIPHNQWHQVTIELSGELNGEGHEVVTVKQV